MKVSKKIFSLALGLSVFATSIPTPGCFAMTADDTGHPEEEPGMFGNLFELLPDDAEGPVGNPERDHSSPPPSRSSSRSSDDETTSSRPVSPVFPSDDDGTLLEEESVGSGFYSQPLLEPRGEEGSVSGSNVPKFFAKTVDVAVVWDATTILEEEPIEFISNRCNGAGNTIRLEVEGKRRNVKFDLIDRKDLGRLKNYRVIIYLFSNTWPTWEEDWVHFARDVRPINTHGSIIFTPIEGEHFQGCTLEQVNQYISEKSSSNEFPRAYAEQVSYMCDLDADYLKKIVERFDEADRHFSSLALTPSQRTGVKRGGIAAACVGGALFAIKKVNDKFKKPNQKKLKKQHKNDKKSEQNQIANA